MTNIQKIKEAKALLKQAQNKVDQAIKLLPDNTLDLRRQAQLLWCSIEIVIGEKPKRKK